ncbi:MAG: hypothetical protein P8189_24275 [Anaerolineae bacterium]
MALAEVSVPDGFRQKTAGGALTIRWRGPYHWVFLTVGGFGLVLNGLLLIFFALTSRESRGAPILFTLGAVLSGYLLLVGLCNRTLVRVSHDRLVTRNGPLPCPFPLLFHLGYRREFVTAEVKALYIEGEGQASAESGWPPTYGLRVVTIAGREESLLTRLDLAEACFVEREIEDFLGLEGQEERAIWEERLLAQKAQNCGPCCSR